MQELIGVYGSSGFGRQVMPLLRLQYANLPKQHFVFIDDANILTELNGYKVLTYEQFLEESAISKAVTIAIADTSIRNFLSERLMKDKILSINVWAQTSLILDKDTVEIGEGSILCNNVCIKVNIKIGKFFHANTYSYVSHDCIIGDYVTFAPRVSCNGNVHIHDYVYIGTGAIIKQGTPDKPLIIGKGAIIGMGAVVTKDVRAGTIVVGNPARELVK